MIALQKVKQYLDRFLVVGVVGRVFVSSPRRVRHVVYKYQRKGITTAVRRSKIEDAAVTN